MKPALEHLAVQRRGAFEHDARSNPQLLPRVHQRLPAIVLEMPDQQALDRAAAGHAPAEKPRRDDARVVDDEQIARRQQVRKRRDRRMIDSAGHAVESHEPRAAPLGRRVLRNKF